MMYVKRVMKMYVNYAIREKKMYATRASYVIRVNYAMYAQALHQMKDDSPIRRLLAPPIPSLYLYRSPHAPSVQHKQTFPLLVQQAYLSLI